MRLANRIAICITFAAATLTATAQQQPQVTGHHHSVGRLRRST